MHRYVVAQRFLEDGFSLVEERLPERDQCTPTGYALAVDGPLYAFELALEGDDEAAREAVRFTGAVALAELRRVAGVNGGEGVS